jgi:RNA polymerase sigma-70 factor (ECF subfamily)
MADRPPNDVIDHLAAARAGSRDALGQVLENYRAYLLLIANRELDPEIRAKGGASDLVQETFLEAQRDFGRFQGTTGGQLQAWLQEILQHNVANFVRHYRYTAKRAVGREVRLDAETPSGQQAAEPAMETPSPSGHAVAREQAEQIEEAVARLPEDYRRVVQLRYQEGRSFQEIAQALDRSENAVRKLWLRAIERLQQEMDVPP